MLRNGFHKLKDLLLNYKYSSIIIEDTQLGGSFLIPDSIIRYDSNDNWPI